MRILEARDYVRMPWKNGGGETWEILVLPEGASLDAFDCRVSMARVAADGPFSVFPGIDRTLAVLEGNGLRLAVNGQLPVELLPGSEPFSFPGDASTRATLVRGEIVDFNVMTRRERSRHEVTRVQLGTDGSQLEPRAPQALLFCQSGAGRVQRKNEILRIGATDSLLIDQGASREKVVLGPEAASSFLFVELWPA